MGKSMQPLTKEQELERSRAKELLDADEIYQALRHHGHLKVDVEISRTRERREADKIRLNRLYDSGNIAAYEIERRLQNQERDERDEVPNASLCASYMLDENRFLEQTARELIAENASMSSKLTACYFERAKLEDQILKLSAKLEIKILKANFKGLPFPQGTHNATTISEHLKCLGFSVGKRKVLEWLKEWPGSKDAWHDSKMDRKPQYRFLDDRKGRKNLREFAEWCAERKLRAK